MLTHLPVVQWPLPVGKDVFATVRTPWWKVKNNLKIFGAFSFSYCFERTFGFCLHWRRQTATLIKIMTGLIFPTNQICLLINFNYEIKLDQTARQFFKTINQTQNLELHFAQKYSPIQRLLFWCLEYFCKMSFKL